MEGDRFHSHLVLAQCQVCSKALGVGRLAGTWRTAPCGHAFHVACQAAKQKKANGPRHACPVCGDVALRKQENKDQPTVVLGTPCSAASGSGGHGHPGAPCSNAGICMQSVCRGCEDLSSVPQGVADTSILKTTHGAIIEQVYNSVICLYQLRAEAEGVDTGLEAEFEFMMEAFAPRLEDANFMDQVGQCAALKDRIAAEEARILKQPSIRDEQEAARAIHFLFSLDTKLKKMVWSTVGYVFSCCGSLETWLPYFNNKIYEESTSSTCRLAQVCSSVTADMRTDREWMERVRAHFDKLEADFCALKLNSDVAAF